MQSSWPCQKHPWTKITFLRGPNTFDFTSARLHAKGMDQLSRYGLREHLVASIKPPSLHDVNSKLTG
jgi:hypothetical protein